MIKDLQKIWIEENSILQQLEEARRVETTEGRKSDAEDLYAGDRVVVINHACHLKGKKFTRGDKYAYATRICIYSKVYFTNNNRTKAWNLLKNLSKTK